MTLELIPRTWRQDISGFTVFSNGDFGEAHVMAHRLLGAWLAGHDGEGSDWTHLQWHMAVFELAVGRWTAAVERFEAEILPVAASSDDALTDAPGMLWRLALAAPNPVRLDWEPVRRAAVRAFSQRRHAYVELHGLLALAGARDLAALDHWLGARPSSGDLKSKVLVQMAIGLRAYAASDFELAARALSTVANRVSILGGSHAQNQLFSQIARLSAERASDVTKQAA